MQVGRIIHNRARCKKCGDIIESINTHDFVTCSCGAISIDGGHDYLKRSAENPDDFEDRSEIKYEVAGQFGVWYAPR